MGWFTADKRNCSSLAQEDIPAKLRCAICSKLAVNAFRLPCCEQAICENCHSTLPASCPVCEHSPLSADDCKPHKALRTTIKVFLRTEEKKRESNRPKDTTPITPVEPPPASATPSVVLESRGPAPPADGNSSAEQLAGTEPRSEITPAAADGQGSKETGLGQGDNEAEEKPSDDSVRHTMTFYSEYGWLFVTNDTQEHPPHDGAEGELEATPSTALVPGQQDSELVEAENAEEIKEEDDTGDKESNPDGSGETQPEGTNGAFPTTTGFAPGFDQMQMMMAMQNGFGNFPMMGE